MSIRKEQEREREVLLNKFRSEIPTCKVIRPERGWYGGGVK